MQRSCTGITHPHTVEVPHDLTSLELLALLGKKHGSAQGMLREESITAMNSSTRGVFGSYNVVKRSLTSHSTAEVLEAC